MNYTQANKAAWEDAFVHQKQGWKVDPADKLLESDFVFLQQPVLDELAQIEIHDKAVGQFCCNNGRELFSLLKLGAASGVGFDIADNFVQEARRIAEKTGLAGQFVATDILEMPSTYTAAFDLVFISVGVLCWFPDLVTFFGKVAQVLRPEGTLLMHEGHPFTNMLVSSEEPHFDAAYPDNIVYSYFKAEPWVETHGIDYIGKTQYESPPLYSFSHPLSSIFNALISHNFRLEKFQEYNVDISAVFEHFNEQKLPLSYLLRATRQEVNTTL